MLHIINRHCNFSNISINKERPNWFSRYDCFKNLTSVFENSKIHIIFDGNINDHFLNKFDLSLFNVEEVKLGSGALSFIHSLNYALNISNDDDSIFYFVEDDYMHRKDSLNILLEGIKLNKEGYITLYDHKDKYFLPEYTNLMSRIYITENCHWRTTPSTTDTFCISKKILKNNIDIFTKWSTGVNCSMDHKRSLDLWKNGVPLLSCIPGYATHCEPSFLSPCIDWNNI